MSFSHTILSQQNTLWTELWIQLLACKKYLSYVNSVKINDAPYHAKQALTGGRDLAQPIFSVGATGWCVVNVKPRPLYPLQKDTVSIVQEVHLIM